MPSREACLPDLTEQETEYYPNGLLKRSHGSQTYDTTRTHDPTLRRRSTLSATNISGQVLGQSLSNGYEGARLETISTPGGYAVAQAWHGTGAFQNHTVHTRGSQSVTMSRDFDPFHRSAQAGVTSSHSASLREILLGS